MSVRDDEIKRIEQYAAGLGIKVVWKQHTRGGPGAEWAIDGSQIIMYTWNSKTKTEIVMDFIHELAHHMAWVNNNRKDDQKTIDAFHFAMQAPPADVPKEQRRLIYENERDDARFQDKIVQELNIKVPKYKIQAEHDISTWMYKRYWLDGKFPDRAARRTKKKELRKKYRQS
jgi:hypothetical protein